MFERAVPFICMVACATLNGACSSSDDEPQEPVVSPTAPNATSSPTTSVEPPPVGDPMAVSPCNINSGFDGDERCILPPDPSEGFQLHVGPIDYDDPEDVQQFLLEPNIETVECWHLKTDNAQPIYNQQRQYRMRPGTHHLILKNAEAREDGWGPCPGGLTGSWGGSQRAVADVGFGDIAPEDAGYADLIDANMQTAAELHYYNFTEGPVLREIWVNFYEMDPALVTGELNGIALIGGIGMSIPPGTDQTLNYSCANELDQRRVVSLTGHVHAHTTRFSAWTVRGGTRELVFEMYNWSDPATLRFNTVTQNVAADPVRLIDGGHTGLLYLDAGDSVEWECEVHNDSNTTLRFANEAYTAEMCIAFGATPQAGWQCIGG